MERGEPDASVHYRRALNERPADLTLSLGLAESLEAEGKAGAVDTLASAVAAQPQWAEGQTALARMRWEAGEGRGFTRDLERAVKAFPASRELWIAYVSALAAADLWVEAADAAGAALAMLGEDPGLLLLNAINASAAGDLDKAEQLFASLPPSFPGRALHEIQHRVRRKQYERALELSQAVFSDNPWDVGAWAMTGLLWRTLADARAEWLHEQPGLVANQDLDLSTDQIQAIAERLRSLHTARAHPIGQSLRGGTQTRGSLFSRSEPEIVMLREAIFDAVQSYWDALPPPDPHHPLLRLRERRPRFHGSWSVRLTGGGFHVAHIHPQGLLSSACYLVVPGADVGKEGWLELGTPPLGLELPLEPLLQIQPTAGRMALFPSTLYHATRPFAAGERLTVAFDVGAA
jgi:tetratricopeptide (TPR) repeat protein